MITIIMIIMVIRNIITARDCECTGELGAAREKHFCGGPDGGAAVLTGPLQTEIGLW